jgi:hypothetical protein
VNFLLSAFIMDRARAPHAPSRNGPPITTFLGEAREDADDDDVAQTRTARRVARRYVMSMDTRADETVLTVDGVVTADQVADVLRVKGLVVLEVEFVASDWPHMATFTVQTADATRRGVVTFECVFSPRKIEQTATVRLVEDDDEHDGDGLPIAFG